MRNRRSRPSVAAVPSKPIKVHEPDRAQQSRDALEAVVAAATAGDESAFSELADRHRRELHAHCYRMLGSLEDSEDLVQETFLRAWRWRRSFRHGSSLRTWLYSIATNVCLDALKRRPRRQQSPEGPEVARILEGIQATDPEPDAAVVSRETIELAFMVAIRHLPPKQRAALILRGAFGLSAKDSAGLLDASVASVNSALQRARRNLRDRLPEHRLEWATGSQASEEERVLLHRYLEAVERGEPNAFVEMMPEGPPLPPRSEGNSVS
jgi:RNA polymerase sigma-70 factor (ECF subfamily)